MQSSWQPQEATVQQLCEMLYLAQNPVQRNQLQVQKQLDSYKSQEEFNNYLALIFAQGLHLLSEVRQSAGLLLKNNLVKCYKNIAVQNQEYIKSMILPCICDQDKSMRKTATTLLATIIQHSGIAQWHQLQEILAMALNQKGGYMVEGALDLLCKLSEDCITALDNKVGDQIMLLVFAQLENQQGEQKVQCFTIINNLIESMPASINDNLERFYQILQINAQDQNSDIRKQVALGLNKLAQLAPYIIMEQIDQVIEFMMVLNNDKDQQVAIEACELWQILCKSLDMEGSDEILLKHLPKLLAILMQNMIYQQYDDVVLQAEEIEEKGESNKEQQNDLSKTFTSSRIYADQDEEEPEGQWTIRQASALSLDCINSVYGVATYKSVLPIINERINSSDWRTKESAILALGAITEGNNALVLKDAKQILDCLLQNLTGQHPLVRQCACWTLGRYTSTIIREYSNRRQQQQQQQKQQQLAQKQHLQSAQGQEDGQQEQQSAPFLSPEEFKSLMDVVIQKLLEKILDQNRKVQQAATGSLAQLIENLAEYKEILYPNVKVILEIINTAFKKYGFLQYRYLYDCISQLCLSVGPDIFQFKDLVMMPIISIYTQVSDCDRQLQPLLDCIACITQAVREQFIPYTKDIYLRCIKIITTGYQQQHPADQGVDEKTLIQEQTIAEALNLISQLIDSHCFQYHRENEECLLQSPIPQVILYGLQYTQPNVTIKIQQFSYALIGDVIKSYYVPIIKQIEPQIIDQVHQVIKNATIVNDPECEALVNNLIWCMGLQALHTQQEKLYHGNFFFDFMKMQLELLDDQYSVMGAGVMENSAICVGRVCIKLSDQFRKIPPQGVTQQGNGNLQGNIDTNNGAEDSVKLLQRLIRPWCLVLRGLMDGRDKEESFEGLARLISANPIIIFDPQLANQTWIPICEALASWQNLPPNLVTTYQQIFKIFQNALSQNNQWNSIIAQIPQQILNRIQVLFTL